MIEKHKWSRKHLIFFIVALFSLSTAQAEQTTGSKSHQKKEHTSKVGQRLFLGLVKNMNQQEINCASCHNVYPIDTLNWNPSALDIAISTANLTDEEFNAFFTEPSSEKMRDVHKDISLDNEQIKQLRLFLGELEENNSLQEKPVINKLLLFLLCVGLLLFSITDLIVLHKINNKLIHPVIILASLTYIGYVLYVDSVSLGRQHLYEPDQPIKFSHKVHAGSNKIACLYCHHTAEESKSAGIPAQTLCLNCHAVVKEGTRSGKFEIAKIDKAVMDGKPVEWVRVHNLPDHVFFSHAQHVNVGKLECQECHGPVEEMDRLYQFSDLSMGWCLDCHRTKKVQFAENEYYNTYKQFHEDLKSGKMDSVLVKDIGGTDCQKCHY